MSDKLISKINWNTISLLGKNKFIKSFSIWIILVPILAKILNNKSNIELFYIEWNLALPFNLTIFYACSLFFGLANILYVIYCPDIIKTYSNASDFLTQGGNRYLINEYINSREVSGISPIESDKEIKNKFSEIVYYFNNKKPKILYFITISYVIGLTLISFILCKNIILIFF